MKRIWCAIAFTTLVLFQMHGVSAQAVPAYDLRDITVGMRVSDLPDAGYVNIACAADPKRSLGGWSGWRDCPEDGDKKRLVRFDFDPFSSREGTVVAGHPVVLTVLIDDQAVITGLDIVTDPKARLYIRKKAFLFGVQVKSRYGTDGWSCDELQPKSDEQPVGGVFLREVCRKLLPGRTLTVSRDLFRRPDQDAKSFVDQTRVSIRKTDG